MTSSKTVKNVTPGLAGKGKISPLGCMGFCLGLLVLIIGLFLLMGLLFTWAFNIVSPIFNGPTIDYAQGLVMWFLIVLIGSVFRGVTTHE